MCFHTAVRETPSSALICAPETKPSAAWLNSDRMVSRGAGFFISKESTPQMLIEEHRDINGTVGMRQSTNRDQLDARFGNLPDRFKIDTP